MANQFYNYSSSYGGTGLYSSRLNNPSVSDPYHSDSSLIGSSRYLSSDPLTASDPSKYSALERSSSSLYYNQSNGLRLPVSEIAGIGAAGTYASSKLSTPPMYSHTSWTGVDGLGAGTLMDPMVPGIKRPTEALYHQSVLGTHNTIGQSEALFSTNSFVKRPRYETASNLPIYPQRPGEKDCAHYMLTRTCKFGDTCKFDHPLWVPEGGIPDWKEVPLLPTSESLPERPGEPDCPYFIKTQKCKFGYRCKFNHPKDKVSEITDVSVLPERPSETICSFYAKTGRCKFGANCIYHHPKDLQIPSSGQDTGSGEQTESAGNDAVASDDSKPANTFVPFTPALLHNSKGLPIRPGEPDCPFYLKTYSCKYGATCRYNHPDRMINPPIAGSLGHGIIQSPATNLPVGVINPTSSFLPNIDPHLAQTTLGVGPTVYPQRPGQVECDFYMKTGQCKFAQRCKFHHPIDRSAPTPLMANQASQQNVKLTLAGLPRREGSIICPFYMKTGTCKFGPTCRYDHPPPGEAIAMATVQGAGTDGMTSTVEEEKDAEEATVHEEQQ